MTPVSQPTTDHEIELLQRRARYYRRKYTYTTRAFSLNSLLQKAPQVFDKLRILPARMLTHVLVILFIPMAIALSMLPLINVPVPQQPAFLPESNDDFIIPLAPLSITPEGELPVPDSAFAAIDALPVTPFDPNLLVAKPLPATIATESANVRGGPGAGYDVLATLPAGTEIQILTHYDDWFKVQTHTGEIVWIAAELLDVDLFAAEFLREETAIPPLPPPKIGHVTEEGLNLRDGPGTAYIGMIKLSATAELDLLARYENWYQVQTPEGSIGWVISDYLEIEPGIIPRVQVVTTIPDPNPALVGVIRLPRVNVRSGPGTAYSKLGTLGADESLDLLSTHKDWFKVRTARGTEGWVSTELLDVSAFVARRVPQARTIPALPRPTRTRVNSTTAAPPLSPEGRGIAEYAAQFVGSKYVWGGASPSGFDCSGFTMYVYKQYGLSLPHSAAGQYSSQYGAIISNPADLAPGDLVFFVNTYKRGLSHVGIYIGNGNVVQALTPGRGVGVASLSGQYWSSRYYGAIRPNS